MNIITLLVILTGLGVMLLLLFIKKTRLSDTSWKHTVHSKVYEIQESTSGLENQIIQADKLLEFTFKKYFQSDQNIGSLLKKHAKTFQKIELNDIWTAHKFRNQLAHDIHFSASGSDKKQIVNTLLKYCKKFSQ